MKYKMIIAYDGTNYPGWQVQKKQISIQQKIEEALSLLIKETVRVIGSGRTDAGVHALAQVAHFKTSNPVKDLSHLRLQLNGILPFDIRIKSIESVDDSFHAQLSALGKLYIYHLHVSSVSDPFTRLYSLHIRKKLDIPLLKEAAKLFTGTHDFSSFSNKPEHGSAGKDPVRTLFRLDVVEKGEKIDLEFEGDGFLYKMVRNITGVLLEVATGKRKINEINEIFAAKDRRKSGMAAPAHPLFLVRVDYPEQFHKT